MEKKKSISPGTKIQVSPKPKRKVATDDDGPIRRKLSEEEMARVTTIEDAATKKTPEVKARKSPGSLTKRISAFVMKPNGAVAPERTRQRTMMMVNTPNFSAEMSHLETQLVKKSAVGRAVDLSVRLLRIADIKEESHSYYCEFLLFLMWTDESLIGKTNGSIDWSKAWSPRITVVNMISATDDYFSPRSESHPVLIGKDTGRVLHVMKINGTYSNHFDLVDFPFDQQKFVLVFRSKDSFDKVYIRRMSNHRFASTVTKNYAASLSHWNVEQWAYEEAQIDNHSLNRPYAVYKLSIFAQRKPQYYVRKMLLIVFITTIMTFLAFFMPLNDIGSRLEFLVSILLTNIAFSFSINQELPKIGYYTQLDIFFQASIVAPFFAGFLSVTAFYYNKDEVMLCEQKVGAGVDSGIIFGAANETTTFGENECANMFHDLWMFRALLLAYILFWLTYFFSYRRIIAKNQKYLESTRQSWDRRMPPEKRNQKEKFARYDRFEIREYGDKDSGILALDFFDDGIGAS
eukprot:g2000.t1